MANDKGLQYPGDESIVCVDCGEMFTWTVGEQLYYKAKSLSRPRRCRTCCRFRRLTLNPDPGSTEDILRRAREVHRW